MTINDDPNAWFPHALAAVVLVGRVADLGSTYLASPSLTLAANPLARRLGWRFALATLLVSAVPYYHTGYGVALAVASLMVAASNLSRVWVMRALGEQEYLRMLQLAAQRTARWKALSFVGLGSVCVVACAALLVWLSGVKSWGFWFACGLVLYAVAVAVHGMLFVARIYARMTPDWVQALFPGGFEFTSVPPARADVTISGAITSKAALFAEFSTRLSFPAYFGANWDALLDCLSDRSWIHGEEIVIDHESLPSIPASEQCVYLSCLLATLERGEDATAPRLRVCFRTRDREAIERLIREYDEGRAGR